jgi:hypothetical protein
MTDSYEGLLGYYYFGFHSALTRYRALTVQGWIVTAAGTAGFFLSLRDGDGVFPLALALCAAVAGISLVHQSVASLDQYVRVPVAKPDPASCPPNIAGGIDECARLMDEIDRGGGQEALAALRVLGGMTERFSFPPLR